MDEQIKIRLEKYFDTLPTEESDRLRNLFQRVSVPINASICEPLHKEKSNIASPDGDRKWGFIDNEGVWVELPKEPMLLGDLGPPPFDVTLPHTNEVRHIVYNPDELN